MRKLNGGNDKWSCLRRNGGGFLSRGFSNIACTDVRSCVAAAGAAAGAFERLWETIQRLGKFG